MTSRSSRRGKLLSTPFLSLLCCVELSFWCCRQRLGDLFAKELRDYAESKRSSQGKGTSSNGMAAQPISAEVMGEMMAYYTVYNRKFANPMKIARICRSFQAKARAANAAASATEHCVGDTENEHNVDGKHHGTGRTSERQPETNDPEAWVDMMYAALAKKNGGVGPRDIPRLRYSSTASCGYVPVETTTVDVASSSRPGAKIITRLGTVPLQEVNGQSDG